MFNSCNLYLGAIHLHGFLVIQSLLVASDCPTLLISTASAFSSFLSASALASALDALLAHSDEAGEGVRVV
jgi:hypothetical protein